VFGAATKAKATEGGGRFSFWYIPLPEYSKAWMKSDLRIDATSLGTA